jgi:DNA-binding CsgD family transcriptional regulator
MPQDQGGGNSCGCRSGDRHLTDREIEVLLLVAAGKHNKEIAASLGISTRTVDHHLRTMLRRAAAGTRAELIARCYTVRILAPASWPPTWTGRQCLRAGPRVAPCRTEPDDAS